MNAVFVNTRTGLLRSHWIGGERDKAARRRWGRQWLTVERTGLVRGARERRCRTDQRRRELPFRNRRSSARAPGGVREGMGMRCVSKEGAIVLRFASLLLYKVYMDGGDARGYDMTLEHDQINQAMSLVL